MPEKTPNISDLCREWHVSWNELQALSPELQDYDSHEKLQRWIFEQLLALNATSVDELAHILKVCVACLDRPGWKDLSVVPLLKHATESVAKLMTDTRYR